MLVINCNNTNICVTNYFPIMIQITKKATPKIAVNLVINNSPPRSFLLANKLSLPPEITLEAPSDLPLCKRAMAISKIDTVINNISTIIPPRLRLIYHKNTIKSSI